MPEPMLCEGKDRVRAKKRMKKGFRV